MYRGFGCRWYTCRCTMVIAQSPSSTTETVWLYILKLMINLMCSLEASIWKHNNITFYLSDTFFFVFSFSHTIWIRLATNFYNHLCSYCWSDSAAPALRLVCVRNMASICWCRKTRLIVDINHTFEKSNNCI